MHEVELRYIAHIAMLTGNVLKERWQTRAATVRELINELDQYYGGFREMFIDPENEQLNLNAMIYYNEKGQVPVAVIDLDRAIQDEGIVTFW